MKTLAENDWQLLASQSNVGLQQAQPVSYTHLQNVGAVRNRGWEWTVNYSDSRGDWAWNAGFNLRCV